MTRDRCARRKGGPARSSARVRRAAATSRVDRRAVDRASIAIDAPSIARKAGAIDRAIAILRYTGEFRV
jgi:hypothetical protein